MVLNTPALSQIVHVCTVSVGTQAEVTEAKRLAMEYKERCEDLERCLESSRGMVRVT